LILCCGIIIKDLVRLIVVSFQVLVEVVKVQGELEIIMAFRGFFSIIKMLKRGVFRVMMIN
jgi:hypothetical protein